MTTLSDVATILLETQARLQVLGVTLQYVVVDHDALMRLKTDKEANNFMVHDPKYRMHRLRVNGVGVIAGDSTRQGP